MKDRERWMKSGINLHKKIRRDSILLLNSSKTDGSLKRIEFLNSIFFQNSILAT
jgi:hypothetical protein